MIRRNRRIPPPVVDDLVPGWMLVANWRPRNPLQRNVGIWPHRRIHGSYDFPQREQWVTARDGRASTRGSGNWTRTCPPGSCCRRSVRHACFLGGGQCGRRGSTGAQGGNDTGVLGVEERNLLSPQLSGFRVERASYRGIYRDRRLASVVLENPPLDVRERAVLSGARPLISARNCQLPTARYRQRENEQKHREDSSGLNCEKSHLPSTPNQATRPLDPKSGSRLLPTGIGAGGPRPTAHQMPQ